MDGDVRDVDPAQEAGDVLDLTDDSVPAPAGAALKAADDD
jgi:hypothetical protein